LIRHILLPIKGLY